MNGTRFREIELHYGCHIRRVVLPQSTAPILIAGRNGSGKTTLLEGMVRTLYGFNRRSEGELLQKRQPWSGSTFSGCLVLTDGRGRTWTVRRDFHGNGVEVICADDRSQDWSGDGNPAASNAQAMECRRRLVSLIGLNELRQYEATACVAQGKLAATQLSEELLRAAAGGHALVEQARRQIADGHRDLTRRPIGEGTGKGNTARELESIEEEIAEARAAIARLRGAAARREPLQLELDQNAGDLEQNDVEARTLEAALGPITDRRALHSECARLNERLHTIARARERIERAQGRHERARRTLAEISTGPRDPEDLPARAEVLRVLWREQAHAEEERALAEAAVESVRVPQWASPAAIGLSVVTVGGIVAAVAGHVTIGVVIAALSVAGACGLLLVRLRAAREGARRAAILEERTGRCRSLELSVGERLQDVPDSADLGPETIAIRVRRHQDRALATADLHAARTALEVSVTHAAESLPEVGTEPIAAAARLAKAMETTSAELVERQGRRDAALPFGLPAGVAADAEGVSEAMGLRRRRRDQLEQRRRELDRALGELAGESVLEVEDRAGQLERQREEIEGRVAALSAAWSLLRDGYEEFRRSDQGRLLNRISTHVRRLSEGHLGPLESDGGLEEATIRVNGRALQLQTPPLSSGEHHAALLAIRLGAADFLAGAGICPPLVIDDPFVHLDDQHAGAIWRLLCEIAGHRQVIVATQDRLLLEHLGAEPAIVLERPDFALAEVEVLAHAESEAQKSV